MKTPEKRLAKVSLAAKEIAKPRIPAEAIQAVTSICHARKMK
jgi:hypothetical protein